MKKKAFITCFGTAALVTASLPTTALAQWAVHKDAKISEDTLSVASTQSAPVIVQFRPGMEMFQDLMIAQVHGTAGKHLRSVHGVAVTLSGEAIRQLAQSSLVSYISMDRPLGARQATAPPPPPPPPGSVQPIGNTAEFTTEPINAPAVWSQGYDGTGIGVAVIDSGITSVPDLGPAAKSPARIVYNQSFLPAVSSTGAPLPTTGPAATNDQFGHGTHVAGLIGGNGRSSTGPKYFRTFSGVAPNVNLINLRVLDANGQGTDSSVIAAIETAISLKSTYNIRIINLSLGRPIWESYQQDPLCQAVEAAYRAGIVVVVAAGNDGRDQALNPEAYGTIEAPGNDPYVLTVGAMRTMGTASIGDDALASYSSKGPSFIDAVAKPDIVAPGNLVSSLKFPNAVLPVQNPSFVTLNSYYITGGTNASSPTYYPLSGTSMATGVTSGAVALLLQALPQLNPDQVKALLMRNAARSYFPTVSSVTDPARGTAYVSHYDPLTVGAGYLDISAALNDGFNQVSSFPFGTAMSPVVSYDPIAGTASLVTDQTALWGRTALWGKSSIYGQNAFVAESSSSTLSGSTALWGRATLTGSDNPTGFTALWGRSAVDGSTALWGRSTPEAATALWGRSGLDGSTALWGRTVVDSSTALWGR